MDTIFLNKNDLLKAQINENSKKIDQYLKELKELEIKVLSDLPQKAVA